MVADISAIKYGRVWHPISRDAILIMSATLLPAAPDGALNNRPSELCSPAFKKSFRDTAFVSTTVATKPAMKRGTWLDPSLTRQEQAPAQRQTQQSGIKVERYPEPCRRRRSKRMRPRPAATKRRTAPASDDSSDAVRSHADGHRTDHPWLAETARTVAGGCATRAAARIVPSCQAQPERAAQQRAPRAGRHGRPPSGRPPRQSLTRAGPTTVHPVPLKGAARSSGVDATRRLAAQRTDPVQRGHHHGLVGPRPRWRWWVPPCGSAPRWRHRPRRSASRGGRKTQRGRAHRGSAMCRAMGT